MQAISPKMNSVDVNAGSGANASTWSEEFSRFGLALTAIAVAQIF